MQQWQRILKTVYGQKVPLKMEKMGQIFHLKWNDKNAENVDF